MENIKHSLKLYKENNIHPGGFLYAVLCNDLFGAYGSADEKNNQQMREIVIYIYNELPSICWGSKITVDKWLNGK